MRNRDRKSPGVARGKARAEQGEGKRDDADLILSPRRLAGWLDGWSAGSSANFPPGRGKGADRRKGGSSLVPGPFPRFAGGVVGSTGKKIFIE